MTKELLAKFIKKQFGDKKYKQSMDFPSNKVNIIFIRENPIKVNSIILDNDREFHLIINENKGEIFHDCPSFLVNKEINEKICVHFIKLLLLINEPLAIKVVSNIKEYKLISEDFGSRKKSKNYLLIANSCFKNNNNIEGLSYLNKAIINQSKCENLIENYLNIAIKNNLFIEFFEFLKNGYESGLEDYFLKYNKYIEKGFRLYLKTIPKYSFFDILRTINSIDKFIQNIDIHFITSLYSKFNSMINSTNFNEKYFSIYFIKKNFERLIKLDLKFKTLFSKAQFDSLKKEILDYFFSEIANFCVIEKLKLLKKQFSVLEIHEEYYINEYKKYKEEIKEIEKKVYLKKFAFLKLLIEKYNIKKTKGDFKKIRNTYTVFHSKENQENPVYNYIISRLGFYGTNEQIIKATDIGINYFILKELYFDDLKKFTDILYYQKQFWGDIEDLEINSLDGFSLLTEKQYYNYDIDKKFSNINDVMIIEWDLANKPRQGSIVNAFGSQIIIPDQNNPLFHDLKPFDLCYCMRTPVKIEGNILKTINVIAKCSFKDAINSIAKGMTFIEGYYPLSLIKNVLEKKISPFEAYKEVISNPNKTFIPYYAQFVKDFKDFLFKFINKEQSRIFDELKINPKKNAKKIIALLNLEKELVGLDLPYDDLINNLLSRDMDLIKFKSILINEIHSCIKDILKKREYGSTLIFNLKKLKFTPFFKYTTKILQIRKEEFESVKVLKFNNKYDLSELIKTFYGKKFSEILNLGPEYVVSANVFNKIMDFASKLNLKLNIIQTKKK
ncbi:MAG: hypothetical protein ACTSQJ_02275 [Promethearchaeota archaeon]